MATKRMNARPALEATKADDGTISLTQTWDDGHEEAIYLDPGQVPTVIEWLEELREGPAKG